MLQKRGISCPINGAKRKRDNPDNLLDSSSQMNDSIVCSVIPDETNSPVGASSGRSPLKDSSGEVSNHNAEIPGLCHPSSLYLIFLPCKPLKLCVLDSLHFCI